MLIGGLRALLVQALNPRTMAAVAQHSNYKSDPWSRLVGTTDYIMVTTFGDSAAAEAAIAQVRSIHDHIKGTDGATGRDYDANDPELLLWVHAAEVDSFLTGYMRYGRPLSKVDADRYISEKRRPAELIGIPRADLPDSVASLRDYLDAQELMVTPAAREAMRFILVPPVPLPGGRVPAFPGARLLTIPGRAGWTVYAAATIALLPKRIRKLYGLPWIPVTPPLQAAVFALTRAMRTFVPPPPSIRDALARQKGLEATATAA
jgi:uncharacterized protein (DUF2236 family)